MQAWEEKYYEREEGREEGLAEGRAQGLAEGLAKGEQKKLLQLIEKKLARGKSIAEIADALEEDEGTIRELIKELSS